jgi:Fe-Mn family superoxide dismutase
MNQNSRIDRRSALAAISALGGAAAATAGASAAPRVRIPDLPAAPLLTPAQLGWDPAKGEYVLPPLPYPKDALEPHIDAQTMEIHHDKHHKSYVDGLNKALAQLASIRDGGDAGLVKHWSREVSFHGSGHINHTLFWHMMAPAGKGGGGQPSGSLAQALEHDFGSFERFTAHFKAAAIQVEGSGWAWLVLEPTARKLLIIEGEKQQNLMVTGVRPLLGVDVWEHAYYLKYQNRRADYVNGWMNVVNWPLVQKLFDQASA